MGTSGVTCAMGTDHLEVSGLGLFEWTLWHVCWFILDLTQKSERSEQLFHMKMSERSERLGGT